MENYKFSREKKGRKEVSFKTKHAIITGLIVFLVVVLIVGGGITIYKYGDKIRMYNAIADKNVQQKNGKDVSNSPLSELKDFDVKECGDMRCVNRVATAKATYGAEDASFCNSLSSSSDVEKCKDQFYKEKAINTKNAEWCGNVKAVNVRDYCYYTIYVMTKNKELCSYLTSEEYKNMC